MAERRKRMIGEPRIKRKHLVWILAVLLLLALGPLAVAQVGTPTLSWWTVDGGGGTASGDVYTISGTVGQPEAGGVSGDGHYTVSGGFWDAASPPPPGNLYLPIIGRQ
jgi:hypothetical protein